MNDLSSTICDDNLHDKSSLRPVEKVKFELVLTLIWLSFKASATVSLNRAADPGPVKLRANLRSPAIAQLSIFDEISFYSKREKVNLGWVVHIELGNT